MKPEIDHNIFTETGCLNKDALLRYRDNKLPQSQKHAVERHLIDCPLCSEALEGFALVAGIDLSNEVSLEVHELTGKSSGSLAKMNYWAIAASVAAIILLSYYTYVQFNDVSVEKMAVAEQQEVQEGEVLKLRDTIHLTESRGQEIETPAVIQQPTEKDISTRFTNPQVNKHVLTDDEVTAVNENNYNQADASVTVEAEERINNELLPEKEVTAVGSSLSSEVLSGAGATPYVSNITYMDNLKVIDYSSKDAKTEPADLSKSVPSVYQNKKQKNAAQEDQLAAEVSKPRKVQYLQLLAEPIAMYNEGRYESAIARFDELLQINKDDENALFYKGMSLYHLKEYEQAIRSLSRVSVITTAPFGEEARFYAAKSYLNLDNKSKAIKMFREIVAKKGFYAEKANEELELLY